MLTYILRHVKFLKAKYFLCALILLWSTLIFSQQQENHLVFGRIDVETGLSSNTVYAIFQDNTGFIWFGTDDGLNRYDGYNFKVFRNDPDDSNSISSNNIWSLMTARSGNIWVGTKTGELNRYDPRSEKFVSWKIESDVAEENSITCSYEDKKGNIWVGTYRDGLYKLDPLNNTIEHWSSDPDNSKSLSHYYVRSITGDDFGNIYVATYIGFNKFNPSVSNEFERYYHNPSEKNSICNNIIWSISKSSLDSNQIWLGTANGLTIYNMAENTFSRIEIPNPQDLLYGTSVGQVIEQMIDGEKIIWVNSYAGLLKMNLSSGETKRFLHIENNQQSLIDNQINQIFRDLSGVVWLATDNGISYLSPKNARFNSAGSMLLGSESSNILLRKNITAIVKTPDHKIWFGTTDGLYYFSQINNKVSSYPEFENTPVWSLGSGNDNDLWVGTFGTGLKQIFLKTGLDKSWDLDHPDIQTQAVYYNKSLLKDRKNNVWVGYWGAGVSRINSKTNKYDLWLNDPDNPNSLSNNDVWVIKEDRLGRIWLGTQGGGLNLFEDEDKVIFHRWTKQETNMEGLNSNNIYSMCEAAHLSLEKNETVLWIGTSNGLNKVTIKNKGADIYDVKVAIVSYTINDGLPDNSVKSILEDDNGNLWLGTGFGISFFNIQKKIFTNFSTSDGLTSSVFNFESALKTNSGLMLFGSTHGINIFKPGGMVLSTFKPPLSLTDFLIFNTRVKAGDGSVLKQSASLTEEIVLNYNHNVFSFEFAALDFNSPKTIKYAYIMEGFEKEWVYSGNRRLATYTNLDPGDYTFKFKSTNADGVWNENAKSISIIITPPFWMTWWFRGLIIFAFLSVGPIIYYRRVNHLKKEGYRQVAFSKQLIQSQEEERKRIASELHDSLGQDLLVIKNLALMNKNKDEQFDEISKTAGFAIDEVRRISYNLHPYQLDRLGLSRAINSMFTNIESVSKIKFDINIGNVDNLFEKEKEINIYRIVQECVTNIIKHSGANKARVVVEKEKDVLLLEIGDNGKGFNFESTKSESKGFGLKNLENRVSFLGGNLEFKSNKEFKTQIKVKIPLG